MRTLLVGILTLVLVFFSGSVFSEPLRSGDSVRQEAILPVGAPDRNLMAPIDSYLFVEDAGGAGVLVYYDDPRTDREIDYIELYDIEGHLLVVTWIDHLGVCHAAMDRGLLNPADPVVDGTLVSVAVGKKV